MARGRLISGCLSTSRKFAALALAAGKLGEFAQSLYPLIVVHCDDFGRMSGDAWSVKFQAHPTSARSVEDFNEALDAMERVVLIERYDAPDGSKCLAVNDFDAHQTGLHKRTQSKFPEPPGNSRKFPEIPSEQKGREQKGTEQNKKGVSDGFAEFWNAYPRKVAKPDALKAWAKLKPDPDLQAAILDALAIQARAWTDKKYIPHPATWLNGRRWEDEISAAPNRGAMPTYDPDWCHHEPKCNSRDWHDMLLATGR